MKCTAENAGAGAAKMHGAGRQMHGAAAKMNGPAL